MRGIDSTAKKSTWCLNADCGAEILQGSPVVIVWVETKDYPEKYREPGYKNTNYASGVVCDWVCFADYKVAVLDEDGVLKAFSE